MPRTHFTDKLFLSPDLLIHCRFIGSSTCRGSRWVFRWIDFPSARLAGKPTSSHGYSRVTVARYPVYFFSGLWKISCSWRRDRNTSKDNRITYSGTVLKSIVLYCVHLSFLFPQDCKNPTLFRHIFFRLFPLDLSPMSYRTIVLCKSVSLSIAANSASFLTCVAEWLGRDLIANSQDGHHLPGGEMAIWSVVWLRA